VGCSDILVSTVRNVCYEAALGTENIQECVRDRLVADAVWKSFRSDHAEHAYSSDFAEGFKAGYRDFVEEGGRGRPPALPPKCYWGVAGQTPQGHAAVADWFAGFHQGAAAAQESGARQLVIVPSSLPHLGQTTRPQATPADGAAKEPEELPSPRPVTPDLKTPVPDPKSNVPSPVLEKPTPLPELPPSDQPPLPPDEDHAKRDPAARGSADPGPPPVDWWSVLTHWQAFMQ
jgi:hypothetical protein